jgi:hypothetical protein
VSLLDQFDDPNIVGASEYRAIHGVLEDLEAMGELDRESAIGVLREFEEHARALRLKLEGAA